MSEKTKDVLLSIFASLLCIVIGLLVGLIILYCINAENALDGFQELSRVAFTSNQRESEVRLRRRHR